MTSSALKLAFAPADYLVTWRLPTDTGKWFEAHGSLTVAPDQSPNANAHGEFPHIQEQIKNGGAGFPQIVELPQLAGRLSNGANVLMVNARVTYWFDSQAIIEADAALITLAAVAGDEIADYKKFEIQVGGLDAIAGVSPIKKTTFPKEGAAGIWSAELNDKLSQEWSDQGAAVSLDFNGSIRTFDPFSFRMGFSPVLRASFAEGVSFREIFDAWVQPIRKVVSIATGRPEALTYAVLRMGADVGHDSKAQVFGIGITQAPYESRLDDVRKVNSPLRLKTDEVSLLGLVRTWQSMADAHHPLIETYGAMLHTLDQHPRSRFLLLIQAIEGTRGYETKASLERRTKAHQQARHALIESVGSSLDAEQLKFLQQNLGKFPPGGLTSALTWLAKQLPGDVHKRLDDKALIARIKAEPTNASSTADALRIIRNQLAHGTLGYDAHELNQVVTVLELMVRAHALQLLGCPKPVIERLLNE